MNARHETQASQIVARTKKNWLIHAPGYKQFPMIILDGPLDHDGALAFARTIWPRCTVE
ncbi:hypothetical protein LCG56_26880 [Pseudomonas cannabina pv. alisalensis]|uniref:Uncharacterized protein n=1 Tax=Pseudomonas syringae pv. maculicola str. ES4326 TaxID=629265 RepID=A0A8T8BZK5_PSEYM|nr:MULTISPECIES: hypothetical protein [Pseudomonas syringae group]QHE96852.1 hypothetical protein PMA4326_009600 [Pseudomonas syringae pv. maculicola str. ES4326]UBY97511.1 hypothetical protein LCG56_26880 [Pseudomonas cannabina pv. alisalensis]